MLETVENTSRICFMSALPIITLTMKVYISTTFSETEEVKNNLKGLVLSRFYLVLENERLH